MTGRLVEVRGLSMRDESGRPVLDDVSLGLEAGGSLAVVGESGAGKTTLALALFGRVRRGLAVCAGEVRVAGEDVLRLRGRALRAYRRARVSGLSQDPALSLTPTMSVWALLGEAGCPSRDDALALLASVGLSGVEGLLDRRPGALSGGQRRRVALARAMASRPRLLVLDEPTSGVDPETAAEVVDAVRGLARTAGCAVLAITHDLSVARRLGGGVAIMDRGRVVEQGPCSLLHDPADDYTRRLVGADALSSLTPPSAGEAAGAGPLMRVRGLCVDTPDGRTAVSGLSFELGPGDGVALTGASGAGKSTVVRALSGQRPARAGSIELAVGPVGAGAGEPAALVPLDPSYARRTRDQLLALQVVPQDPSTSLNPAVSVGAQLRRACARRHPEWSRARCAGRAAELMRAVGLDEGLARCLPHEVSGGQAQRVAIARALAHEPRVLVCDESTSALDSTTQEGVLATLARLRDETGVALVMVTHAPQVARAMCSRAFAVGDAAGER